MLASRTATTNFIYRMLDTIEEILYNMNQTMSNENKDYDDDSDDDSYDEDSYDGGEDSCDGDSYDEDHDDDDDDDDYSWLQKHQMQRHSGVLTNCLKQGF